MNEPLRVLVIEDGTEYVDAYERFLTRKPTTGPGFVFERAGSGVQALDRLARGPAIDVVVLDMRFDRAPEGELLGDVDEVAERFNGDLVQARQFVEDHQGTYILAAIRATGCAVPVLLSYDFTTEPRRWERLVARHAPLAFVADEAGPNEVARALSALVGAR